MVAIASRASWGARFADGDATLAGLAGQVFAHHTVTAHLAPGATVAAEQAQMRHIEHIGQSRFGRGISYNVLIFPSGRAYQGVSWNRRGTHTGGHNSTSRSIAFAGNYEVHEPTAAQIATARAIFAHGRGRWWVANAPLRGHRAVSATACPGRHVQSRLAQITAPGPDIERDDMFSDADRNLLNHIRAMLEEVPGRTSTAVHDRAISRVEGAPTTFLQDQTDGVSAALSVPGMLADLQNQIEELRHGRRFDDGDHPHHHHDDEHDEH